MRLVAFRKRLKGMKNFKGEKKSGRKTGKSPAKQHAGKSKVLRKPDLA